MNFISSHPVFDWFIGQRELPSKNANFPYAVEYKKKLYKSKATFLFELKSGYW